MTFKIWHAIILVVLVVLLATVIIAMASRDRRVRGGGGRPARGKPRPPRGKPRPPRKPVVLYLPDQKDLKPGTFVHLAKSAGFAVHRKPSRKPVAVGFVRDRWAKAPWKKQRADVWGRLTVEPLANKRTFHGLFNDSGLVPAGWVVPPHPQKAPELPPGVWMFRPEDGWGGWRARPVTSDSELEDARRALAAESPTSHGVVTRYITDPDLHTHEGRQYKYHLRVWAVAASDGKAPLRLGYFKRALLIRAKKPYDRADFGNAGAHDTHSQGDSRLTATYPDDYGGDVGRVDAEIARLVEGARPVFAEVLGPIETARAGFHLMGLDIMIDSQGRGWLIEVNSSPSFPTLRHDISGEVYEVIWRWAVAPLLGRAEPAAPEGFVEVAAAEPETAEPEAAAAGGGGSAAKLTVLHVPGIDPHPELFVAEAKKRGARVVGIGGPKTVDVVMARDFGKLSTMWQTSTRARVWSYLSLDHLTDKAQFQELLGAEDFAPDGWATPRWPEPAPRLGPGTWMYRPAAGYGGWGNAVVRTDRELLAARKGHTSKGGGRGVVTRYVADTDTFRLKDGERRKYTLRVYLLVTKDRAGETRVGRFRTGLITLARKPYDAANTKDPGVYDTHSSGNPDLIRRYPDDFPGDVAGADAQLDRMFRRVAELGGPGTKVIAGAEAGFRLLGADLIVDRAGKLWLLEINGNPRFPRPEQAGDVYREIWGWALDHLLGRGKKEGSTPEFVELVP